MSKIAFTECDEGVYALMFEILNEFHLSLRNSKIKCLFYDKPRKRAGRLTLATAEAVSAKYHYLTEIDFIISIYKETWDTMADQEKKALIDHELHHCFVGEDREGNPIYKTVPHDFEDFKEIIERYGLWQDNIYVEEDIEDAD